MNGSGCRITRKLFTRLVLVVLTIQTVSIIYIKSDVIKLFTLSITTAAFPLDPNANTKANSSITKLLHVPLHNSTSFVNFNKTQIVPAAVVNTTIATTKRKELSKRPLGSYPRIEHFTLKNGALLPKKILKHKVRKITLTHIFKWKTGKDYTNRKTLPVIKALQDQHVNYLSKAVQKIIFHLCGGDKKDCFKPDVAYYNSPKPSDELIVIGRDGKNNSIQKFKTTGEQNYSVITKITVPTNQPIVMVTAYYNRTERLALYLDFVNSVFESDPHIFLQIVTFFVNEGEEEENKKSIQHIIDQKVLTEYKDRVYMEQLRGKFSRGRGLNVGSKISHQRCPSCVLLFYDIDMRFRNPFLDRCRALAVRDYSVYFPTVYSLLEPQHPQTSLTQSLLQNVTVDNGSGIWRIFGFGMVCVHAGDFVRMKGVPEYTKWGLEDNNYYKFTSKQMITYRLIEPDLIHTYHKKL